MAGCMGPGARPEGREAAWRMAQAKARPQERPGLSGELGTGGKIRRPVLSGTNSLLKPK